ncbi:MAG: hypothetical protein N3E40_06105 [Dehalococcoidia bacterium]|nr:hypothetical protein [Dehalococcoidia bacterium]
MKTLIVGAHGLGTETTSDMETIARLLYETTGYEMRVIPVEDSYAKREWFKHGYLDLCYAPATFPARNEGNDPRDIGRWGGPFQMRMVASVHTGSDGFIVRGDSSIRTIYDIRPGIRFGVYRNPSIAYPLLAWCGLYRGDLAEPNKVEWLAQFIVFDNWEESILSLAQGKSDIIFASAESPFVHKLASVPPGVRFLELPANQDPEGAARFRRFLPFGSFVPAPEVGVKEAWGKMTFSGTASMWCRPDFDPGLAYELTRWFDAHYERFKNAGYKLAAYNRDAWRKALDVTMAPVHEGTITYLKEIGLWKQADDVRQEYNQKLMDSYCELWEVAISGGRRRGILPDHKSSAWVSLWHEIKLAARIPRYAQMTDQEIVIGLQELLSRRS